MQWTKTVEERLADRFIRTPGGCWYWTGRTDRDGYGRIDYDRQDRPAYRVMLLAKGHNLDGLEVDHLCRNRRCVNPLHLDVVTRAENNRRQWLYRSPVRRKELGSVCKNGHTYTEETTHVTANGRVCRLCTRAASARYKARKAAALATAEETP